MVSSNEDPNANRSRVGFPQSFKFVEPDTLYFSFIKHLDFIPDMSVFTRLTEIMQVSVNKPGVNINSSYMPYLGLKTDVVYSISLGWVFLWTCCGTTDVNLPVIRIVYIIYFCKNVQKLALSQLDK